jgi:hypothetical protein
MAAPMLRYCVRRQAEIDALAETEAAGMVAVEV